MMTNTQRLALLRAAQANLKQTTRGYTPDGLYWKRAFTQLDALAESLKPQYPMGLGPVWRGGTPLLQHDLTHATSGIPLYPAFDDAFTVGTPIIAPETLEVTRSSSANPGEAFYATGASKLRYWFGHLDRTHSPGTRFRRGDTVGKVAVNRVGGGPHVHVGVNVELLWGKGQEFKHNTNYRHGQPTMAVQLAQHDL